jgi:spermidine/putrescine transport system substrate-binding protein
MEKVDPSLVDAPLIFPDAELMAHASYLMSLDDTTAKQYAADFSQAIS